MISNTVKKEITSFIIWTAIGALLQLICREYLKRHPELVEKYGQNSDATNKSKNQPNNEKPNIRKIDVRDGALIYLAVRIVITVAHKGILTAVLLKSSSKILDKVPKGKLVNCIYHAVPSNLVIKGLALPENEGIEEKDLKWLCIDGLQYLYIILKDDSLPFEFKNEQTYKILSQYVNLSTYSMRVSFVLCVITMVIGLSTLNPASYIILLSQLLKAVKAGKINKVVLRAIIRKLKRRGIIIDPEVTEFLEASTS